MGGEFGQRVFDSCSMNKLFTIPYIVVGDELRKLTFKLVKSASHRKFIVPEILCKK